MLDHAKTIVAILGTAFGVGMGIYNVGKASVETKLESHTAIESLKHQALEKDVGVVKEDVKEMKGDVKKLLERGHAE